MCIIDDRDDWYWDITAYHKLILFKDIEWMTLKQVICKYFDTTSWDIKNSPWLYWICWVPIQDYNQKIDGSFINKHITKRRKKNTTYDQFCPKYLTMEEYTFCSDYRRIVLYDWNNSDSAVPIQWVTHDIPLDTFFNT